MMNMLSNTEAPSQAVETTKNIISLLATCLGLAVIIIGLKYAMDIFHLIFTILQSPTYLKEPIEQLAQIVGGSLFGDKMEGGTVFLANTVALAVYCGGALVCAWLTLSLMHTGARIVSLSVGDRSAVKKLLQSAFGNRLQPKVKAEEDTNTRTISRS
jgi:hypothetical protein